MSLGKCGNSLVSRKSPFLARTEFSRLYGEEVPEDPPKQYLSWGETRCGAGVVTVGEDGSGKPIIV